MAARRPGLGRRHRRQVHQDLELQQRQPPQHGRHQVSGGLQLIQCHDWVTFYLRCQPVSSVIFFLLLLLHSLKKAINCLCLVKIVNIRSATRVASHNQFPPVTNCKHLLMLQVHLMVSMLYLLALINIELLHECFLVDATFASRRPSSLLFISLQGNRESNCNIRLASFHILDQETLEKETEATRLMRPPSLLLGLCATFIAAACCKPS